MKDISKQQSISRQTRELAAATLAKALREVLASNKPVSETGLRDRWLYHLQADAAVFPDGWYMPPPHGVILLFATGAKPERIVSESYRGSEVWPSDSVFLDRNDGLIMAYASPVHKQTGMIGDFGITLYLGERQEIKDHLAACLSLDFAIGKKIKADMKLSDVAKLADTIMQQYNLSNTVLSVTDAAGVNIGHTVPESVDSWSADERQVFNSGNWPAIKDIISHKRLFVNSVEETSVSDVVGFTIEPRPIALGKPELPAVAYHTIVVFDQSKKQQWSNFDNLFALVGMDYMPAS